MASGNRLDSATPTANVSFNDTIIEIEYDGDKNALSLNDGDRNFGMDDSLNESKIDFKIEESGNISLLVLKEEMIDLKNYFFHLTHNMKQEIVEEQKTVNDILFYELKKEISILKKEKIDQGKEVSHVKGQPRNQPATISFTKRPTTKAAQVSNTTTRKDYEKWLIPKTYAQKAGKNARNFQVTLKNRYSDLETEAIPCEENNLFQHSSNPYLISSMQVKSYKKKDSIFPNQYPENQGNQRKNQYKDSANPKIAIFSDSMAKRFNMDVFNKKLKHGEATLNAIPGARAEKLNHCATFTLKDESPDVAIIHVGINDLLSRKQNVNEVADEIKNMAVKCRSYNVKQVALSGVVYSTKVNERLIEELNRQIKEFCIANGFTYICNENIKEDSLWVDGIHLNNSGKNILSKNFLNFLNHFLYQEQNLQRYP